LARIRSVEAEWHAGTMMLLPSSLVDRLRNDTRVAPTAPVDHPYLDNPSKLARSFLDNKVDQSKRARVLMLLPSWLVSPFDGVAAMLVLLRPWTSTALYLEM
jgi:hypothetical protein